MTILQPHPKNSMDDPDQKVLIEAAKERIKRTASLWMDVKVIFCVLLLVACAFLAVKISGTLGAIAKASEKLTTAVKQSNKESAEVQTLLLGDIACAKYQLNSIGNPLKFAMAKPADIENQLIVLTLSCATSRNPEQAKKLRELIFNGPAS